MSGDDPFPDKIAASPADDALRLVYADWLEERGDARAALLRAQVGVLLPAIDTKLSLDPDWLARIDRTIIENCQHSLARCGQRWEDLPVGAHPRVRICARCHREVRHCLSVAEALPHVEGEEPIAISSLAERHPGDLPPKILAPSAPPQMIYTNPPPPTPPPRPITPPPLDATHNPPAYLPELLTEAEQAEQAEPTPSDAPPAKPWWRRRR